MDGTQKNNSTILRKLFKLQQEFKSTKDARNNFANYNYRNVEQMLSTLKPLLAENNLILTFSDSMKEVGGEIVMETVATLTDIDNGDLYNTKSSVVVDTNMKGCCKSQASGASLTYLHKYSLMSLLAIDDGKSDPDSGFYDTVSNNNNQQKPNMMMRIDGCNTKEELSQLWESITEGERVTFKKCFSYRKNKLNIK